MNLIAFIAGIGTTVFTAIIFNVIKRVKEKSLKNKATKNAEQSWNLDNDNYVYFDD